MLLIEADKPKRIVFNIDVTGISKDNLEFRFTINFKGILYGFYGSLSPEDDNMVEFHLPELMNILINVDDVECQCTAMFEIIGEDKFYIRPWEETIVIRFLPKIKTESPIVSDAIPESDDSNVEESDDGEDKSVDIRANLFTFESDGSDKQHQDNIEEEESASAAEEADSDIENVEENVEGEKGEEASLLEQILNENLSPEEKRLEERRRREREQYLRSLEQFTRENQSVSDLMRKKVRSARQSIIMESKSDKKKGEKRASSPTKQRWFDKLI